MNWTLVDIRSLNLMNLEQMISPISPEFYKDKNLHWI